MSDEEVRTEQEPTYEAGAVPGDEDPGKRDLSGHLDRIWREIKELARQVESETRRGGRIARLRFEIRGLRQDLQATAARLGRLVYEAHLAGGKRPALSRLPGYDEAIQRLADLQAQIDGREERIAELRRQGEPDPEA